MVNCVDCRKGYDGNRKPIARMNTSIVESLNCCTQNPANFSTDCEKPLLIHPWAGFRFYSFVLWHCKPNTNSCHLLKNKGYSILWLSSIGLVDYCLQALDELVELLDSKSNYCCYRRAYAQITNEFKIPVM